MPGEIDGRVQPFGRLARRLPRRRGEKIADIDAQRLGDGLRPSCRDAGRAGLVFLNLLAAHADQLAQMLLGQAERAAPQAHPGRDAAIPLPVAAAAAQARFGDFDHDRLSPAHGDDSNRRTILGRHALLRTHVVRAARRRRSDPPAEQHAGTGQGARGNAARAHAVSARGSPTASAGRPALAMAGSLDAPSGTIDRVRMAGIVLNHAFMVAGRRLVVASRIPVGRAGRPRRFGHRQAQRPQ